MKFSTKSIHIGQSPEKTFGAIIPPIFLTSTYVQESPGKFKGYDYTRAGNPNFTNLEKTLAALETARYATVFSSGLGALTAIASTLSAGDKIIAVEDIYGGTSRLFKEVFQKFGIQFEQINFHNSGLVKKTFAAKPKIILLESPTNPLLRVIDIKKICGLAGKYNITTIVDNTFASPYFQQPLTLGADVVVHSSTKYLGGHSDLIGGAVITNHKNFKQKMDFARKALGLNPSPFDAWLTSRSLKTLAVRMEKHQKNALAVAEFLANHPKVKKVYYPGLPSHPDYEIAKKQMSGFSGVVSAEFKLPLQKTQKLISSFRVFSLAESLGGVESLVDHPATMTHSSISRSLRQKFGLTNSLVRFSIGIENKEDLISDLEDSLGKI